MSARVLRVATYNIRALRDDRRAVVRVITALDADLVCVQEAPRFLSGAVTAAGSPPIPVSR